jgi:hypothetical protein
MAAQNRLQDLAPYVERVASNEYVRTTRFRSRPVAASWPASCSGG